MTVVANMEQFNSLAEGSTVETGNRGTQWVKVANGWRQGSYVIADRHFAGEIARGAVRIVDGYEVGQVYDDGTYLYVLVAEREGGTFDAAKMSPGSNADRIALARYQQMVLVHVESQVWTRVTTHPRWQPTVLRACTQILNGLHQIERQAQEITAMRSGEASTMIEYKARVQAMLHEWARQTGNDDGGFGDVLSELGLARPEVDVTVTYAIDATARRVISPTALGEGLPAGAVVSGEVDVNVPFSVTLTERRRGPAGECVCDDVGITNVQQLLTDAGLEYEDIDDFTVSCSND